MARTYTLHTTDCAAGVEQGTPAQSADYPVPPARKHKCIYHVDPLPADVLVTFTDDIVPVAGEKEDPGSGSWVLGAPE